MKCRYASCPYTVKRPTQKNYDGLCRKHIAVMDRVTQQFEQVNEDRRITFHPETNPFRK